MITCRYVDDHLHPNVSAHVKGIWRSLASEGVYAYQKDLDDYLHRNVSAQVGGTFVPNLRKSEIRASMKTPIPCGTLWHWRMSHKTCYNVFDRRLATDLRCVLSQVVGILNC